MRMAKAIHLEFGPGNEPPLRTKAGINTKTVGETKLAMNHVIIPPGGRNQRHYHIQCDAGMYILKGRVKMFFGPDHEAKEEVLEAGEFFFVPKGEIHGLMNLSDTEPAEMVSAYGGAGSFQEAKTVFVEPSWEK
jgi:uncharacterized RmlC-like cupin family protein